MAIVLCGHFLNTLSCFVVECKFTCHKRCYKKSKNQCKAKSVRKKSIANVSLEVETSEMTEAHSKTTEYITKPVLGLVKSWSFR